MNNWQHKTVKWQKNPKLFYPGQKKLTFKRLASLYFKISPTDVHICNTYTYKIILEGLFVDTSHKP